MEQQLFQKNHLYSETDLDDFERKLFSPSTPVHEVGAIIMTLAHIPTARAYAVLMRFKASQRGELVPFLDLSLSECQFGYLEPLNDREERDYLALKIVQELQDQVTHHLFLPEERELYALKYEIELGAVRELVSCGELPRSLLIDFDEYLRRLECGQFRYGQTEKEKIINRIRCSISTPRYRDVNPDLLRDIHWDQAPDFQNFSELMV